MNAKYMAVFAAVIMFAGCASVLAYADDADVDAVSADKTVYVLKDKSAQVNIKQTLNGLNSYYNTVKWTYSNSGSDTDIPESAESAVTVGSASIWMADSELTFDKEPVTTDYVINVIGNDVTTSEDTISVKMTISSTPEEGQGEALVQTLEYTIKVNVLPAKFSIAEIDAVDNMEKVGDETGYIKPQYTYGESNTPLSGYVYYAIGLPNGVAMDSQGWISGTPNITDWQNPPSNAKYDGDAKTMTYTVTVVATHVDSNLAMTKTFDFVVNQVSDEFSLILEGDNVKSAGEGVYMALEGSTVTIKVKTQEVDKVYEVYSIKENVQDSNKEIVQDLIETIDADTDSIDYTLNGTGKIAIVAMCGSTQDVVYLFVIDPVEDIKTGIGFVPGSSMQK